MTNEHVTNISARRSLSLVSLLKASTVFCLVTGALWAAGDSSRKNEAPKTMVKAIVRLKGPDVKEGSFAAMPKTVYRAGPHYARIEDPPDARQQLQKLTIIAEPDAYSVNLLDKKGTHAIDQGGATDIHLPIVFDPTRKLTALNRLEFGDELEFFKNNDAVKSAGPIVNAEPTDEYQITADDGKATLVTKSGSNRPIKVSWKAANGVYEYEYMSYTELPFDPALFKKPAGVTYREMPPDDNTADPG